MFPSLGTATADGMCKAPHALGIEVNSHGRVEPCQAPAQSVTGQHSREGDRAQSCKDVIHSHLSSLPPGPVLGRTPSAQRIKAPLPFLEIAICSTQTYRASLHFQPYAGGTARLMPNEGLK